MISMPNSHAFSVIGVPSPAQIVDEATDIVEGYLQVSSDDISFRVTEVLKGSLISEKQIKIIYPSGELDQSAMLSKTIMDTSTHQAILLGNKTDENVLMLDWLFASVWPHGGSFATFPNKTFAQSQDFVQTVLDYQVSAKASYKFVNSILEDLSGPQVYAALDFIDVGFKKYAHPGDQRYEKALTWIAFTQLLTSKQVDDPAIQQKILSMTPKLPASLLIPYLLSWAKQTTDDSLRTQFISAAGAVLMSRRLIEPSQMSDVKIVKNTFTQHLNSFRITDASFALKLFDKPFEKFPGHIIDGLLGLITGKEVVGIKGTEGLFF